MAKLNKVALGLRGESKACRYLKRRGYKILKRNWRNPFGEVDVIARKGEDIVFIEVKTRLSDNYGLPNEAVDKRRRERYRQAANFYFLNREINCVVRFDIIEVFKGKINHLENAF